MTQRSAYFGMALGLVALLAAPGITRAGAMLKEHECVGKDTALAYEANKEDAFCTPPDTSQILPGKVTTANGNFYGAEDVDESTSENFTQSGALEVLPAGSNIWQTIPTVKEPGFYQVGFPATMEYTMYIKSSSVMSDLEIVCSVCAERPQFYGPGQTYTNGQYDDDYPAGSSDFINRLNIAQSPWTMSVSHSCSGANPLRGPGCGGSLQARTLPGLRLTTDDEVTFIGCKRTVIQVENRGQFFRGDHITARIDIPASARNSGRFDVTSCEANYIRACLPGEGQFKDICIGEP